MLNRSELMERTQKDNSRRVLLARYIGKHSKDVIGDGQCQPEIFWVHMKIDYEQRYTVGRRNNDRKRVDSTVLGNIEM